MNYYFEKLEQLVHSLAKPEATIQSSQPDNIEPTVELVLREKEQVRRNIIQQAFETPEQGMMELFIDKQQSVLTRLINELHSSEKNIKRTQAEQKIARALYQEMQGLLLFLQTYYAAFFNLKANIPLIEKENLNRELRPLLEKVSVSLKNHIPGSLLNLVENPLKELLSKENVSYKESGYLKSVLQELEVLAFDKQLEKSPDHFKVLLITANFNSPEIGKYFTTEWTEEISKEDRIQEKLRILKFAAKDTRQLLEKKGWSLNPEIISLKELLLLWLNEETNYYEAEQTSLLPAQHTPEADAKIHTSMSVPQLALLFRLLKADNQITNSNQSDLLKVVTNSFTTLKKESFSYGHLHGKYYKIDAHTRRTVYDMLMRLLHLSRKVGLE